MAEETTIELATLRFEGARFRVHALDVECAHELLTYRTLVLKCAIELWRRKHPERIRLPSGFEERFRLHFDRVLDGSAVVPLRRIWVQGQGAPDLGHRDEFDEAAELIDATIRAAGRQDPIPESLPTDVLALFRDFGSTLREGETLFIKARHSPTECRFDAETRKRLAEWTTTSQADDAGFDESARPIWEQVVSIGRVATPGTWDNVPTDLSSRIDEIVYGHSRDDR
jgi:hypothetical protein